MGIVINQRAPNINFVELLKQLEIHPEENQIKVPSNLVDMAVHVGGPVETGRGFVLHSADYVQDATLVVDQHLALTATVDILKSIAEGGGPHHSLLALGYAGWAPGQLEHEIQANGWLSVPADPELVFGAGLDDKWGAAMAKIGIDHSKLSGSAGHA